MALIEIQVSCSVPEEDEYRLKGFSQVAVNLNPEVNPPVYIWYKNQGGVAAITRIQFSSDEKTSNVLSNAGYTKVQGNLTPGGSTYLWYYKGSTKFDTAIISLEITTNAEDEASKMTDGLERVGCKLRVVKEDWMYLWVKREKPTFICDVTATTSSGSDTSLFNDGYIRIDVTTNTLPGGQMSTNYLWYRQSTAAESAITDLNISTNDREFQELKKQGYTHVINNLNEGTGGPAVYLWYKRGKGQPPVENMLLLLRRSATEPFEKAGNKVIQRNINNDNKGFERFLCFRNKS